MKLVLEKISSGKFQKVLEYCPGGSLEDLIVQHQNDQKYFKGQESMKIQEHTKSIHFEIAIAMK